MRSRRCWTWGLLAVLVGTAGCGGSDGVGRVGGRTWTVMLYVDADNDLEGAGILNVNQLEKIGSRDGVNFVVQLDRGPGHDTTNDDWTTTRRFLVEKDDDVKTITSPALDDLGEVDMADPQALRDFITWAADSHPADHFVLVVWNHGAGWRTRGVNFDDTSNSFMTMADLNAGLDVPGVHLDLIAFDASLMGMLEVAYEIRERADLIAASEESPPGEGYPYDTIASQLVTHPDMTPEDLGRVIVVEHVRRYPDLPVTQALIVPGRLPAFAALVDDLAGALLDVLSEQRTAFDEARDGTTGFKFAYYRDLFGFAQNAQLGIADPEVRAAAAAVTEAFNDQSGRAPVVASGSTFAAEDNPRGLSIYLPAEGQFFSGYGMLSFARDFPQWLDLARVSAGLPRANGGVQIIQQ